MNIEIGEVVYFISSFLVGRVPRSRVDTLVESLANRIALRLYIANITAKSVSALRINVAGEPIDHVFFEFQAAEDACLSAISLQRMLPENMVFDVSAGSVYVYHSANGLGKCIYSSHCSHVVENCELRRPQFSVEFSVARGHESDKNIPLLAHFELANQDDVLMARELVATRFGSIRPRTYVTEHGFEHEMREDNFTRPSVEAYLRLLNYLDTVARLMCVEGEDVFEIDSMSLSNDMTDVTQTSDDLCEEEYFYYCFGDNEKMKEAICTK